MRWEFRSQKIARILASTLSESKVIKRDTVRFFCRNRRGKLDSLLRNPRDLFADTLHGVFFSILFYVYVYFFRNSNSQLFRSE